MNNFCCACCACLIDLNNAAWIMISVAMICFTAIVLQVIKMHMKSNQTKDKCMPKSHNMCVVYKTKNDETSLEVTDNASVDSKR